MNPGAADTGATADTSAAAADSAAPADTADSAAPADTGCVPRAEIPYDGIDQDCDGADLVDVDGDGWDAVRAGGADCDDHAASVRPDAPEACGNLVDDDCDGVTDEGCTTDAAGPPDPGGLYWICGVVAPAPALWVSFVAFGLIAWRRGFRRVR